MGYRVGWSPEAVEDVESIAEYISKDSVFYARAVVTKILKNAKILSEFPSIGRVVLEYNDQEIRERIVYSYRLIYHISGKKITIVAVVHGRRMLEPVVSERIAKK